jgi:hypothetical protein
MSLDSKRPRTLLEISRRVRDSDDDAFDRAAHEFLEVFYEQPEEREAALADRPEPLDPVRDAYLAAVAEHLARSFHLPTPEWSETHGNNLIRPIFAGDESMIATLTVHSPTAFRRRLLFVSKDTLAPPRRTQDQAKQQSVPRPLSGSRP